jgi:hypothetical protein
VRLSESKLTSHLKLVTVARSAVPASVNSYRSGLLKVRKNWIRVVNLKLKKTSGARHAFGSNSSDLSNSLSRSRLGLRGPRALGHVFGKRFVVG